MCMLVTLMCEFKLMLYWCYIKCHIDVDQCILTYVYIYIYIYIHTHLLLIDFCPLISNHSFYQLRTWVMFEYIMFKIATNGTIYGTTYGHSWCRGDGWQVSSWDSQEAPQWQWIPTDLHMVSGTQSKRNPWHCPSLSSPMRPGHPHVYDICHVCQWSMSTIFSVYGVHGVHVVYGVYGVCGVYCPVWCMWCMWWQ